MLVGQTATLTLEGTVDAGQGGNTITNVTTAATGDQMDPISAGDDLGESVTVNAPVVPPMLGSIGNLVFEDLNNNGIRDAGDPGEPGVTIELLDGNGDPILDGNGDPILTVTDADGFYEFTDLPAGDYRVRSSLPGGHFFTEQDAGADDTIDSDVDNTGLSSVVTLGEGENNSTVDVGIAHFASLGDTVFFDDNGDGVQNAGEVGVANVVVNLLDGSGSPVLNSAGVAISTTTDANGNYTFQELRPGDFQVEFVAPTGTDFTVQNVGDDALDSDADPTTGRSQVVTLVSEENNTTIDAGLINNVAVEDPVQDQLGSISGTVFQDDNNDGIQDVGEVGIAAVSVTLTGTDVFGNSVEITILTDAAGNYSFDNLNAGTYSVTQAQPLGFEDGIDTGAPSTVVGNDLISNITLGAGQSITGNTFAELSDPGTTPGFAPNLPSFATFNNLSVSSLLSGFTAGPGPIYSGIPINANANPLSLDSGLPVAGGYNTDFATSDPGSPVEVEADYGEAVLVESCDPCNSAIPVEQPVQQIIVDECGCGPVLPTDAYHTGEIIEEGQPVEIPTTQPLGTPLGLTEPSFLKRFSNWLSNSDQT